MVLCCVLSVVCAGIHVRVWYCLLCVRTDGCWRFEVSEDVECSVFDATLPTLYCVLRLASCVLSCYNKTELKPCMNVRQRSIRVVIFSFFSAASCLALPCQAEAVLVPGRIIFLDLQRK